MQEQIFLQENGVTVSQGRFVTPSQTFAMQGVTSVAQNVFRPSRKRALLTMAFGAVVAPVAAIVLLSCSISGVVGLLIGAVIMGVGVFRFWALRKPDHQVVLNASTTASTSITVGGGMIGGSPAVGAATTRGSSQNFVIALSDKDGESIGRVVGALNEALVARGQRSSRKGNAAHQAGTPKYPRGLRRWQRPPLRCPGLVPTE